MLNVEDGSPNVGRGGRHVTANPLNQAWGVGRGGGTSRALAHVCRGEIPGVHHKSRVTVTWEQTAQLQLPIRGGAMHKRHNHFYLSLARTEYCRN